MRLNENQVFEVAKKALKDLGFGTTDLANPIARFSESVENDLFDVDSTAWLVGFEFISEDFDIYPRHKAFIAIRDADGIARNISVKGGHISLCYDPEADKYFKKPGTQPK
jgi:hypothetical protein